MFLFRQVSVTPPVFVARESPTDYLQIVYSLMPDFVPPTCSCIENNLRAVQCLVPAAVAIHNGVRIGEVLSLRWCQVMPSGLACIKPEKSSRAKMIHLGFVPPPYEGNLRGLQQELVFPINYKSVYKYTVLAGLGVLIAGHINHSVTHTGRYRLAGFVDAQFGIKATSEALGHRSESSTLNYLGKTDPKAEREKKRRQRALKKLVDQNIISRNTENEK